ncbi:MAG: hypothetical protein J6T43_04560 [Prevotella sp.]|nr:hypothetical protein [Prevotella sp.]
MKKYVKPVTELFRTDMENFVCASPTGEREGQWGAGQSGSEHADPNWDNEGYNYPTEPIEDDYGLIDSQGKAWGDLWDWD